MTAAEARWVSRDGKVRHAFVGRRTRHSRPVCGIPSWEERYDQPAPVRCPGCEARLAVEVPLTPAP